MSDDSLEAFEPDTIVLHADDGEADDAVAPPIYQTAQFWATDAAQFDEMATSTRHARYYTRYGNPTSTRAALVVAALEGAEDALLFPSGMSAITSVFLTFLRSGDHVVCQEHVYAGTIAQLQEFAKSYGITLTFVDQRDVSAFERAIGKSTRLVILETPSHPLMYVTDLAAVTSIARAHGAMTVIDNTAATPVNQRPLSLGVDLIMHSATKSLSGHSDIQAGAVAGRATLVQRIHERNVLAGAIPSPHDSWLLLRGMRTLALRVQRQNENGMRVATALQSDPRVAQVHYPGLPSHPQHALARAQMRGFAGIIGIELRGGFTAADAFITRLKRVRRAASIGAVQSLIVHPAAMWKTVLSPDALAERGINDGLVRLSLGIDAADDILRDITEALDSMSMVHA